ncbi:cupin domain-containing protein [Nocardioides jensenii]|uniref:cupin domain-containing protein n=1 Tax=Nocardioides jensenii TaxID=1843 RepID=UPI001FDECD45|nr:cupin domain-containing protein [Nocardioides jensenii]
MPGSALDLLSGDAQTFVEKVWASRVHVHHADPDQLVGLLSLDDADTLLTSSAIRTPSIRLAKDGDVLPESSYTRGATLAGKPLTGLVDSRKALALFADGATIVFQGLHRYWPPITRLIAELELELGHPCQANAYLTPPGAQGFAVHSDSHDVFVFQTAGSKQWQVHGPDCVQDIRLDPGLSMYLPTGTPHAARAQDTVSLHVTVGINQLTWRGLVQRSLAGIAAGVPDEHLPAGYLDDPRELAEELAGRLEALAEQVRGLDATAAVEAEVRRFLTSRSPRLAGGLRDVLATDTINDTTRLRRRPGHPCVLLDRGDRIDVLLGDRSLDVPAWLRSALDEVRARRELGPGDLAEHLDPQSRLVLCRRLVREGLLEVVT